MNAKGRGLPRTADLYAGSGADGAGGMSSPTPSIPGGYVKSYRKELDSEIWLMAPLYHRVWHWLRTTVQYEPFLFPTSGKYGIWVLPGQRILSIQQIAERVKWTECGREVVPNKKTIMAILTWLESREMVTIVSNARGTLITLVNWHTYNPMLSEEVTAKSNGEVTLHGYKEEGIERKDLKTKKPSSPEALRLSEKLADLILQKNPDNTNLTDGKKLGTVTRWASDIENLHRIDGQPWEKIDAVIDWCQCDIFWHRNILSGDKLRKQWNALTAQMRTFHVQTQAAIEEEGEKQLARLRAQGYQV